LRLARLARRDVYGEKIIASGPVFRGVEFKDSVAYVRFDHADGGLILAQAPWRPKGVEPYPKDHLIGFEIRDADGPWREAQAQIAGDEVVVSQPDVKLPDAVRYAWSSAPRCNLYNQSGLPAAPFVVELTNSPAQPTAK